METKKNNCCREIVKMLALLVLIVGVTYFFIEPFCSDCAGVLFNSDVAADVTSSIVIAMCAYLSFRVVVRGVRRIRGASGGNGDTSPENADESCENGEM